MTIDVTVGTYVSGGDMSEGSVPLAKRSQSYFVIVHLLYFEVKSISRSPKNEVTVDRFIPNKNIRPNRDLYISQGTDS